jgi:hypothetical protein
MATNHTERWVETAAERLIADIAFAVTCLNMTSDDAIAYAKVRSVAGPKVWAAVNAKIAEGGR